MNILIVGAGAREHSIAWKIRQSPRVDRLFVAPGNAGTASIAQNLDIGATNIEGLARAAQDRQIDLTVVGPEAPLALGIADRFQELGLPIFGPTRAAAQIECSKVFCKELLLKYGIPTGRAEVFSSYQEARRYAQNQPLPLVIKADGLAAGKGVIVAHTQEEACKAVHDCMEARVFGDAGERVIVEEYLSGQEVSVFAFTDGENLSPLAAACDYKQALDGDRGPNTGGMGSYSPPAFWDQGLDEQIRQEIMEPTVRAMAQEGRPYQGVLYGGLMLTQEGPRVLEFNARLGDPECQVIMPRLKSDLVDIMLSVLQGNLGHVTLEWSSQACVGVVMASGGYPDEYRRGFDIEGLAGVDEDAVVFHAGTKMAHDEGARQTRVVTDGGRVLSVVALGAGVAQARTKAYDNVQRIRFQGAHYRTDIAADVY